MEPRSGRLGVPNKRLGFPVLRVALLGRTLVGMQLLSGPLNSPSWEAGLREMRKWESSVYCAGVSSLPAASVEQLAAQLLTC